METKGYTKIPNDILLTEIKLRLSATELEILLLVARKTFGYQKESDRISLTQFEKYTDKSRWTICKNIKKLSNKKMLIKKEFRCRTSEYMINKDFFSPSNLVKLGVISSQKNDNKLVKKETITSQENNNKLISKSLHTKESKETNTKGQNLKIETNFPSKDEIERTQKTINNNKENLNKRKKSLKETLGVENLDEWLARSAENKKTCKKIKKLPN